MKILITNDDSHRSPLLELAVRYFSNFGDVSLVVPLHEQSWTGKCVTRFDPVHVHKTEIFGRPALSVAGRPADCVNLAVHNLLDDKPDLVVSGINAGFNIGIGFVLSSGTIGACLEANLAGVPAIALSQAFDGSTRDRYIADYLIAPEQMSIFEKQAWLVLDKVTGVLFSELNKTRVLATPITWNVNLPFNLGGPDIVKYAPLGKTRYGKCFLGESHQSEGAVRTFHHKLVEQVHDDNPLCDSSLIRSGVATVCPLDVWRFGSEDSIQPDVVRDVIRDLGSIS